MHNPNSSILKAFTNHLLDLYDDLNRVFPKNPEVRNGKTWIEITKKINSWESSFYCLNDCS